MHCGARTELRWLKVAWARCEAAVLRRTRPPFAGVNAVCRSTVDISVRLRAIPVLRSVTCEAPKLRSAKTAPSGPDPQRNGVPTGAHRNAGEAGPTATALAPHFPIEPATQVRIPYRTPSAGATHRARLRQGMVCLPAHTATKQQRARSTQRSRHTFNLKQTNKASNVHCNSYHNPGCFHPGTLIWAVGRGYNNQHCHCTAGLLAKSRTQPTARLALMALSAAPAGLRGNVSLRSRQLLPVFLTKLRHAA